MKKYEENEKVNKQRKKREKWRNYEKKSIFSMIYNMTYV